MAAESSPNYGATIVSHLPTSLDVAALAHEAEANLPWIVERRHHLHRHPELSFQEVETAQFLRRELAAMGLEPGPPIREGVHGFCVDIDSPAGATAPRILLRADFDALPIQEENDVAFRSTRAGIGHMCGHDCHTAMLLGAARLLVARREQLPVGVRLVFQHAEEVAPGGALDFVRGGALEGVAGCFALHVSPRVPKGKFGLRVGESMAAVGTLQCRIIGKGGHGAAPHETIDPMPAAAAAILALQQIASRRVPPIEACVVSVTTIRGGTAFNQIPDTVEFGGTFRTYNVDRIDEIERWIGDIVRDTARAWGCTAEAEMSHSYPPVVNDANAIAAMERAATELFGGQATTEIPMGMGGEDFAYFALERPSGFGFLGVAEEGQPFYSLHHCRFLPQDDILWRGAALLAAMPWIAPQFIRTGVR